MCLVRTSTSMCILYPIHSLNTIKGLITYHGVGCGQIAVSNLKTGQIQ